jgi:stage II sporulation protein D
LIAIDGRSLAREVAVLSTLGFALPRRATSSYLRGFTDREELESWLQHAARLVQKFHYGERERPGQSQNAKSAAREEVIRLTEFVRLVVHSIYAEPAGTMGTADVEYSLSGVRVEAVPQEAREDVAILLREGILRLPADGLVDGRAAVTRGQAIETLARALSKPQSVDLSFKSATSSPAPRGRLVVTTLGLAGVAPASRVGAKTSTPTPPTQSRKVAATEPNLNQGFDIAGDAWLFRTLGGESYAVQRLTLIGGERVTYHLNASWQVDFLEVSLSEHNVSTDRLWNVDQWKERVPVEEMQRRLARARINVGRPESIKPVAFSSSNRVTEVEITGDRGRAALRRPQLRGVLGLKESLFVVDRETDARGHVVAFVFRGRGRGHGVGLCQAGAYALAKDGYSHSAILQKYYTGVTLKEIY